MRSVCLGEGVFVGAGAVDGRDGDVEQAQVDRKLAAVVVQVVEHDVADELDARDRENLLTFCREAPDCGGLRFAKALDVLFGGFFARFEGVEDFLLIFWLLRGEGGRIDFVDVILRDARDTAGNSGDMAGEFADAHGFCVRRPGEFVGWDALENATRGGGFSMELVEHGGKGLPHFESLLKGVIRLGDCGLVGS